MRRLTKPIRRVRQQRDDRSSGHATDRGFVLTWFALLLVVLMAMAGFSVDVWNWWYTAQRAQNAADAGALGGVVYLPDGTAADAQAKSIVQQNGFTLAETSTAIVSNNQLTVAVDTRVKNFFTGLLGVATTDIRADATAEFTGAVPMGSPKNFLGNDPDRLEKPDHWLSVSGAASDKQGGDRYQSFLCTQVPKAAFCTGDTTPPITTDNENNEYTPDGYIFKINARSVAIGSLDIQIFDPMHNVESNQNCANNASNRMALFGLFADYATFYNALDGARGAPAGDSARRFHTGQGTYCVGDSATANNHVSTFILRAPDGSPADSLNNPVLGGACAPKQYRAIESTANYLQVLYEVAQGIDTDPIHVEFARTFRQWESICTVPAATVDSYRALYGNDTEFIVQVRTNSPFGFPCTNPDSCDSPASNSLSAGGRNHFSIRSGYGSTLAGDVRVFADGRLPIHAASTGASTEFFLARVGSAQAGRFLEIEFFDTGDAADFGTITILQPDEIGDGVINGNFIPFTSCTFTSTGGATTSSGCRLLNVVNNNVYQGQVVKARVAIPTTYACGDTGPPNPLACWVKVRFAYPPATVVFDHTVWSAGIVGDPVRLTE